MKILLETERLRLREFTSADAENLVELDSDPEVMRHLTGGVSTPRETIINQTLPRFLKYHEETPGLGFWAAAERDASDFIGWFHLRPVTDNAVCFRDGIDEPEDLEIGYRLRRSAWGRGLATEGSLALIDHAFNTLESTTVVAHTEEKNLRSIQVMTKLGMQFVERYSVDGHPNRIVKYALNDPRQKEVA